jgi:hypothetical protein
MSRRRGRPRKRNGTAAPAGVQHYTWLKPIKSRPPEPFFDSGPALAKRCPETALLCAILEDAFVCFYETRDPGLVEEAQRWFFADGGATMFSFLSICEALGLDAREIRQRLAGGLTRAADSVESNEKTPRRRSSRAPEVRKPQR